MRFESHLWGYCFGCQIDYCKRVKHWVRGTPSTSFDIEQSGPRSVEVMGVIIILTKYLILFILVDAAWSMANA
ncbi:hypothetical protein OOU_Y34scaffold00744g32 [Pyricularia oryzae Y34]|uniref:Uncharacterized protein n=2 Tax=Pyricularia oryzae TaxID=318829 RepID=A0AA97PHN0_PYRO3|nr:hypothetical protein OOU_Y34scaffold00744g32 [Pyricularia oryzae Y34]